MAGSYLAELIKLMKVVLGFHRKALRTLSVNVQILPPEQTLPGAVVERGRCSTGESQENVIDLAARTGTRAHVPQGTKPGDASPRDTQPRKRRRVMEDVQTNHGIQESQEESTGTQVKRPQTVTLEGDGTQGTTPDRGRGPQERDNQGGLEHPMELPLDPNTSPQCPGKEAAEEGDNASHKSREEELTG